MFYLYIFSCFSWFFFCSFFYASYLLRLGSPRKPIRLSASFGIAERGEHESLDQLLHEADEWLYHAKESGRNRVAGPLELQPAG